MITDDYDQLQQESHYYNTIDWLVFYLLELGPRKVYTDANEALDREVADRVNEGTWGIKELERYVYEAEEIESGF